LWLALAAGGEGRAQPYPDRPIKLVVTFPAGGAPDVTARALATRIEAQVGQNVVVENRAGANGIIGAQAVANAEPDGYTILHVSSSFVINPSVRKTLPFDIFRDFTPVAAVGIAVGYLLVVNPELPVRTVAEFIAYAKKNRVLYGSPGRGNALHLAAEMLNVKAGVAMEHVPFRGTAPALTAIVAGEIQAMFIPPAAVLPYIESNSLRALGFSGSMPLPDLPDVPLIKDTLPGFLIEASWHGWFAPAKTPPAIVARLNGEVRRALKEPAMRDLVIRAGYLPDDKSPAEFTRFVREEFERYAEAARAAKIEPQ
jgi:tripartite-type tricarboxylate transporter receptor subunit TctC